MRYKLSFKGKGTNFLTTNTQEIVNTYIHNCLGDKNEYHDACSHYAISHLYGGKIVDKQTIFENGGYVIVSSSNQDFLDKLITGAFSNQTLIHDMKLSDVIKIDERFHNGWNYFRTLSPILVKKYESQKKNPLDEWWTFEDPEFIDVITERTIKRIKHINPDINTDNLKIEIPNRTGHKLKKIYIKSRKNVASQCHVSIFCNKDVAKLIYDNGIGQSTGSGFGILYKTENIKLYQP